MKKRFIILTGATNDDEDKRFIEHLEANNMSWWHWLSNSWLVADFSRMQNVVTLRDKAKEIFPGKNIIVFEVTDSMPYNWSGFGPVHETEKKLDMFHWIREVWQK